MHVSDENSLRQVAHEACELVRKAASAKQRTVSLSPEVAAMLDGLVFEDPVAVDAASGDARPPVTYSENPVDLEAISTLEELEAVVRVCRKCSLAETRTQSVFGSGNPHAKLVFVGEAPGRDEDIQGKPFVGRAGQLLTDIIEKGMNLKRSEVYICNVLKSRPPDNRNPAPFEVEVCEPYLIRQLEIIQPRVICALGTYAAQTLLKTTETIGRLRGRWHFYHGIPLRATYHPAYLLRNPADKRKTWEDVLEVLKVYNGTLTPEPGK
jgi:uracil-DNA glycosylase